MSKMSEAQRQHLSMIRRERIAQGLITFGRGAQTPNWKGGRIRRGAYIYLKVTDHPYSGKQGYVAEHRLVVEGILERYLRPEEAVHHINGIRDDNDPDNLEVFSTHGQHTKHAHPEVYVAAGRASIGRRPTNYCRIEKTCQQCSVVYVDAPSHRKKFCSRECHYESQRGKPAKNMDGLRLGWGWNRGMKRAAYPKQCAPELRPAP